MKWSLTATSDRVEVKLTWIKAPEPVNVTEKPSQALKKRQSPSTRRRNAKRFNQWAETRNKAVGVKDKMSQDTQTDVEHREQDTQTTVETVDDGEMTTSTPTRDRATQDRGFARGRAVTPTKYRRRPPSIPWTDMRTVRSPYNPDKNCTRIQYENGEVYYTEQYDINNPSYSSQDDEPQEHRGARPPTPGVGSSPTQHRPRLKMKASRKSYH